MGRPPRGGSGRCSDPAALALGIAGTLARHIRLVVGADDAVGRCPDPRDHTGTEWTCDEVEIVIATVIDKELERYEVAHFFDPEDVDLAIAELDRLHAAIEASDV